MSSNKGQLPKVVMDECMEPVPGVAFASESGSAKTSSASSSTMVTSSMLNWDKGADAVKEAVPSISASSSENQSVFRVDDEDIFVATSALQEYEYYVVI